jgi:hypothetical protein
MDNRSTSSKISRRNFLKVAGGAATIGSTNVTSGPAHWPAALAQGGGGQIGLWFSGTTKTDFARLDNFSGGTMP